MTLEKLEKIESNPSDTLLLETFNKNVEKLNTILFAGYPLMKFEELEKIESNPSDALLLETFNKNVEKLNTILFEILKALQERP